MLAPPPIHVTSASLVQEATTMELRITAARDWDPATLAARGPRSLCLDTSKVRLCVTSLRGHPVLRRVAPGGPATRIEATVAKSGRTLTASFTPLNAGLPLGRFRWSVGTLPRRTATARLLAEPRCFGAAARPSCSAPGVAPAPPDAPLIPAAPCDVHDATPLLEPCFFGAGPDRARATVALLGDSHAEQLRAALDVVAQRERWRVIALTRAGCPFSGANAILPVPDLVDGCRRSIPAVLAFLAARPTITTVFVSAHDTTAFASGAVAGYRDAWARLPKRITHIYVVRDVPHDVDGTLRCVEQVVRAKQAIGTRCAVPRAQALPPDPEADAAQGAGPRVRLIDLSERICTATVCPPVVGGALVLKDAEHLTRAFSYTLGPFLLDAIKG